MSSSPFLAWTVDRHLAGRSGYHVLADYLPECAQVTSARSDGAGMARLRARMLRRFSFSRWCAGGSFDLERLVTQRIREGYSGPVHYLWCDRDLAFLAATSCGFPLVGTFHQCSDTLSEAIRWPQQLKRFSAIIIMSETQRSWFAAQGVLGSRIHRILHGVDVDYFRPASAEASEHFTALAVGGTRRDFALLRQVASAMRDNPRLRFEIVGPHDKKETFHRLPNVVYHDRLSDGELLAKYQQASCLLHLIEDSTANNVINEALACGTPVISQLVGGVPEYVTTDCALLCPPQDGASVMQAITQLASSSQRQQEMRLAARAHALTLDWHLVAEQTRQIHASLC